MKQTEKNQAALSGLEGCVDSRRNEGIAFVEQPAGLPLKLEPTGSTRCVRIVGDAPIKLILFDQQRWRLGAGEYRSALDQVDQEAMVRTAFLGELTHDG
jgi:hypothetical protein